jgi:hypothetical protein
MERADMLYRCTCRANSYRHSTGDGPYKARISSSDTTLGSVDFACSPTDWSDSLLVFEIAAFWTSTSRRQNSWRTRCAAAVIEARSVTSELQCMGFRANIARRRFAAFVVSRSDQHREAVCREILCNLKSDSLICIGYGSNGFSCMAIALS